MIEILKRQFTDGMTGEEKANRVREVLQLTALKIMYDKGYFDKVAFVGGTALRVLFNLRRFSEDLDFSLIEKKGYDFAGLISQLEKGFNLYGLNTEPKIKGDKIVQSAFLKFSGLLSALGISNITGQKLSIKIEVDTKPPPGAHIKTGVINKIFMMNLTYFDLSSLYATKLHACFFRKYTKGRDFYDLLWYISKKIPPNYELLNNAIKQTEGYDLNINEHNFREYILAKLKKVNFAVVRNDVERFLEDKSELSLLEYNTIANSLV